MCRYVMEIHDWLMAFRLKVYKQYSSRWRSRNMIQLGQYQRLENQDHQSSRALEDGGAQLKLALCSPLCVGR